MSLGFSIFGLFFSPFLFLLFFFFAAVIDLLLGLLSVKKLLRKHHRDRQGAAMCSGRKFWSEFLLNFLSIFVHISGSIWPITLIWASLERSFPPAEVEYR